MGFLSSIAGAATGGLFGLGSSFLGASSSKKIAGRQMAFQERMANTAYQRAVEDIKKARLNPALIYSQGGASSPQGASAQPLDLSGVASSAMQAARIKEELSNIESSTDLHRAQEFAAKEQAKMNAASARKITADAKLSEAAIPGAENKKAVQESPIGPTSAYVDKLVESLGPVAAGAALMYGGRNFGSMATQAMKYVRKGKASKAAKGKVSPYLFGKSGKKRKSFNYLNP